MCLLHQLVKYGYLSEAERHQLKEIYHFNPLLFDFVLKRTIKPPEHKQTTPKFCVHDEHRTWGLIDLPPFNETITLSISACLVLPLPNFGARATLATSW
jgi:hypothetical protein